MNFNTKTFSKTAFTILLLLHCFNTHGMWKPFQRNKEFLRTQSQKIKLYEIDNRKLISFAKDDNEELPFNYFTIIEALASYFPDKPTNPGEHVVYDDSKNTFFLYSEDGKIIDDVTDPIIHKCLVLKTLIQVNKASHERLTPVYHFYINHLFEQFLFDNKRYKDDLKINATIGSNILGKDLLASIKSTVIKVIKDETFNRINRVQFDFLVCGTTQWYVDNEEKIVVSTWGEITCKDYFLQLIRENNRHIMCFLKNVVHNIPKGYAYLIGISNTNFNLTPDLYKSFKDEGMSISKDNRLLLAAKNYDKDHKAPFTSLSIKALTNN